MDDYNLRLSQNAYNEIKKGNFSKAIAYFNQVLESEENTIILQDKGYCLNEMKRYDDDGVDVDGVSGWVFRNRYGNKPLTENNCNDGLRRILSYYNKSVRKKELKIRGFTCHKFRHTFATKCEVKEVSERAKKALLGHLPEKDDVTNRYIHPPFDYVQEQAQKLNEP